MKKSYGLSTILLFPMLCFANLPKGSPVCSGVSCSDIDVPLGVEPKPVELPQSTASNDHPALPPPTPPAKRPKRRTPPHRDLAQSPTVTNLPAYYQGDRSHLSPQDGVVLVPKTMNPKLPGMGPGELLSALVAQSIKASPTVPTPIRALVQRGRWRGAFLLGEATLDKELKRVLLNFTKLKLPSEDVYSFQASGLSPSGQVGIEGEFHSDTAKFFLAELGAAAAAGLVDSTVTRHQTSFGTYVQEPSLTNSAKQAATAALSRTADRIAERVKQSPEWTEVSAYQEILVLITDEPREL